LIPGHPLTSFEKRQKQTLIVLIMMRKVKWRLKLLL
jgi:hypothetical protein